MRFSRLRGRTNRGPHNFKTYKWWVEGFGDCYAAACSCGWEDDSSFHKVRSEVKRDSHGFHVRSLTPGLHFCAYCIDYVPHTHDQHDKRVSA